jgi:hypothetical protein
MAGQYRSITRDQLAKFLPDPESIKRFETLFQTAEQATPAALEEAFNSSATAQASANALQAAVTALSESVGPSLALAESRATQALDTACKLAETVQRLELAPPPAEPYQPRYGSFYDTTSQTAAAINTAYGMTLDTTDLSVGVYIGAPTSRIYVDRPSVYNIQFSAQLDNTSGGSHLAYVWLRVNGTDVPYSTGQIRVKSTDGEILAAWNYLASLKAGDYFEVMWSVSDTAVQITASGAVAPVPAIPSVIITVTDNIK